LCVVAASLKTGFLGSIKCFITKFLERERERERERVSEFRFGQSSERGGRETRREREKCSR